MKNFNTKKIWLVITILLLYNVSFAQLNGTYTIGGTSPDYTTLSAAVSDLNASGVSGPVIFNIRDGSYSGSNWRGSIDNVTGASATNTITFQSQSGDATNVTLSASGTSSNNYIFELDNCKYVTIKNLTLENTGSSYGCDIRFVSGASYNTIEGCILTGHTGNSTSTNKARIYGNSVASGSNNTITNNEIIRGSYGIYWRGNNSSSTTNNNIVSNNTFNQNYYYAFYMYYHGDLEVTGNVVNRTGSGTYYGGLVYYTYDMLTYSNNEFNTSTSSTTYASRVGYTNYVSNNEDIQPLISDNVFNVTTTSSNSAYSVYDSRNRYTLSTGNTVNMYSTSSSGYHYIRPLYYSYDSKAENNTYNFNRTNGGYSRPYCIYRGSNDTFTNNTINVTGNGYLQGYLNYYGDRFECSNNVINGKSSSRYMYMYSYRGISGNVANNRIDLESNSGYIYGIYSYYDDPGINIFNNVITVKTSNTCRGLYLYRPEGGTYANNTVHTYGTNGSNNYACYIYNTSSTYKATLYGNLFTASDDDAYALYVDDYHADKIKSDYNNYYTPGSRLVRGGSPSINTNSMQDWRQLYKMDQNSINHDPGYVDVANKDLHIDPTSPSAWAINGRAIQDTIIKTDFDGNPRAYLRADGVPDIGAYEVVPTSTPPNATATPASPVANSTQVFTFAQDTVATIEWGNSVPATYSMRQYTGVQAGPMPAGVGRMYFYTAITTSDFEETHKPNVHYKEPWLGDVSTEANVVIARSSNGGAWEGYNYSNAATDVANNRLIPTNSFDSLGAYTGVENGRIGIRCIVAPTGIVISNITADEADIDWDPIFNPLGYQVYVSDDPTHPTVADWNSAATTNAPSNNVGLSGLNEDTKYYVFVRSICGVKDTSGASVDSFITLITCHDPNISLSSLNTNRVIASWQDVKTAEKYEYVIDQNPNAPTFGTDIYDNNVLAPYLDPGSTYYIHVRTHCNSIYSNSGWSTKQFNTWATNVSNVADDGSALRVYPNPAENVVNIELGQVSDEGVISVMDVTGKVLKRQAVSTQKIQVNVSDLAAGVYMLQYSDGKHTEQVKFNKR